MSLSPGSFSPKMLLTVTVINELDEAGPSFLSVEALLLSKCSVNQLTVRVVDFCVWI